MMTCDKVGIRLTAVSEGCRLEAYQDSGGVWTIGYGHAKHVYPGMVITQAEADKLLDTDIALAEQCVNLSVKVALTQDEFDALTDFVFNLGVSNFHHSTLLKLINANEFGQAAAQFTVWDHCSGKVVAGLLCRREKERQMFIGGDEYV